MERALEPDIAGDPESGLRWTRRTTRAVAEEVHEELDFLIRDRTAARLLRATGYALRVNQIRLAGAENPDRDASFDSIVALRSRCKEAGIPIISVDTKKKELVGRFRNPGSRWVRVADQVNDHDFRFDADGNAVPYAVHDLQANTVIFFVRLSHNTPQFAAECIASRWTSERQERYPDATELCSLADSRGSNRCRPRAWKCSLQHSVANPCNLELSIARYPTGASKWNPIEHHLFSEVSKNWQAFLSKPPRS